MDGSLPAIDREVGKVDTSADGRARFSFKLQVPPGTQIDTEPELCLSYSQGAPNGSLGAGWALGGISCIRRAPSNLAYDGSNVPPSNYDRAKFKFTLDGSELLNIQGDYNKPDTQYTTEVDDNETIVVHSGPGFVVRNKTGRRLEYGTSDDSRVIGSVPPVVREWRLKKNVDRHGNAVVYTYVKSPLPGGASSDRNTCYLSSIRYTSNEKTGYQGNRIVNFEYSARPDPVVQTVQGDTCIWASLLTAIRFGVIQGSKVRTDRSYNLQYTRSAVSGDSCLTSVQETSTDSSGDVSLLPSLFGYTKSALSPSKTFQVLPSKTAELTDTTQCVAVFPMNISGRCLSDLACVQYDRGSDRLSIKTHLANRQDDGTVTWDSADGQATLPAIDINEGFPSILSPDLTYDGRADLVIPYRSYDDYLRFSISQCTGTGFRDYDVKETNFRWTPNSRFITMDHMGRGVSIVQVYGEADKLTFRSFPCINNGEEGIGLQDAIVTNTDYQYENTIDWVQLTHAGTGAKSLIRIWFEDSDSGKRQIKATPFTLADAANPVSDFIEGTTSLLGEPVEVSSPKTNVLPCDINADGTQDIVLATADYRNGSMLLTFQTFFGDGHGNFEKHQDPVERQCPAAEPLKNFDYGEFHVTNFNGSSYPTLSYLYQTANNRQYECFGVDGRSDGLFTDITSYDIATELPSDQVQVAATDINGNGMGSWLFHAIKNGIPHVLPVFNSSRNVDLLEWAQDSMGLRTTLTYGSLADTTVYKTSVPDWKNFVNTTDDYYPVIAASNTVVTQLKHENENSINSLKYNITIEKSYAGARINVRGRGWQGFSQITSLDVSDNVLTTEKYMQVWPFTGVKSQIDIQTVGEPVVKSETVTYKTQDNFNRRGAWKIYHARKILEETNMIEIGAIVRSTAIKYEHDSNGNVTLLATSDTQRGQLMHQSWKRCTYTTINGITNLVTRQKTSGQEGNKDLTKYEPGDSALRIYEYENPSAMLKSISAWSTDKKAFSKTTLRYDDYGHVVETVDAQGLRKTTMYDDLFHAFPVKVTYQGAGILFTELAAFDESTGLELVKLETTGSMLCHRMDRFGRIRETRAKALEQGPSTVHARDFLSGNSYVADTSLSALLSQSYLDPKHEISFERQKGSDGSQYMCRKTTDVFSSGPEGRHDLVEYFDCSNQIRKKSSCNGISLKKTWVYSEYGTRGQTLFESFPTKVDASVGPHWMPNLASGIRNEFDILNRPISSTRPSHHQSGRLIVSSTKHLDGGARIQETRTSVDGTNPSTATTVQLAIVERKYVRAGKEDVVVQDIDENGLRTTFVYDHNGKLIQCTDPAGQIESRSYNSFGDVVTLQNPYQSVSSDETSSSAISYEYNEVGHLLSQVDADGARVTYTRDGRGRPLTEEGYDGRILKYTYDQAGFESLTSVAIFPQGAKGPFESLFEFAYDHRGRIKERKLTLGDGTSFVTTVAYDWQDQVTRKLLPDGVVIVHEYRGSEISSSGLMDVNVSTWSLRADVTEYNSYGRPEHIVIQGSGMEESMIHHWEYDAQGFPLSHALGTGSKSLVKEHYLYNDMDQIQRKHEFIAGLTTDYLYSGKRLVSSQSGTDAKSSYAYDGSGNLTDKCGVKLTYNPGRVSGSKDGSPVFEVKYDQTGRMRQRDTNDAKLSFSYDSFGAMTAVKDSSRSTSVEYLVDPAGGMLQKRQSDGSVDLFVNEEMSIHVRADGSKVVRHYLTNGEPDKESTVLLLGTVSHTFESTMTKRPLSGSRKLSVQFADTKGSVSYVFEGETAALHKKLNYDDFGLLLEESSAEEGDDVDDGTTATYEGNFFDTVSSLVDFGARWYDPLVGRFVMPDDILDIKLLLRTDGLNRYVFENNDPINKIDPTGHWTLDSVMGVIAGAVFIAVAVALTVATAGTASPLLAAAVIGAFAAAGTAGISYSIEHNDEQDHNKFWGGFATTVVINAAIGALAGGAGAAVGGVNTVLTISLNALIGGGIAILSKAAEREVENLFYGTNHDLFENAIETFGVGAITGAVSGAFRLKAPKVLDTFKDMAKKTATTAGVHALKLGWRGLQHHGLDKEVFKMGIVLWGLYRTDAKDLLSGGKMKS